jgi:hypothetical protein
MVGNGPNAMCFKCKKGKLLIPFCEEGEIIII